MCWVKVNVESVSGAGGVLACHGDKWDGLTFFVGAFIAVV